MIKNGMIRKTTLLMGFLLAAVLCATAADRRFTLVIDAGHGGNDAGALGHFSKEKNINLNVALAFGRLVERNCPDVRVVYTRKTDVFVPLHERANIANRNKADLFVSIHTNALPGGKQGRGLETYTLGMHRVDDNFDVAKRENSVILIEKDYKQHYEGFDPNSSESYIMFEFLQDKNMAQSVELAKLVQKRTCAMANRPDKGVKQAGFLVLRETSMPSCLIELGFITTPDEERFLNSDSGVDLMGQGIYRAFVDYRQKYDRNFTVPFKAGEQDDVVIPAVVPGREKVVTTREKKAATATPQRKAEPVAEPAPVESRENTEVAEGKTDSEPAAQTDGEEGGKPVFKVQILASDRQLRPDNAQLKGAVELGSYEENGMYKYTCGASTDYNAIYRLRKSLLDKFPEAFIIAFKDGRKANVVEALQEFRRNRNKR